MPGLSNRCKAVENALQDKLPRPGDTEVNMTLRVKRAQRGDADAFVELMEEHKKAMERVAFGFFKSEEDVADVMQQTVLDAFEHLKELKNAKYFKTWLIRILINNCNRMYNSYQRSLVMEEVPVSGVWEDDFAGQEFRDMISSLPEDSRLIFQLYYGEEFTTKEIALIMEMKENTVKSRLHRGKEIIRQELQAEGTVRAFTR